MPQRAETQLAEPLLKDTISYGKSFSSSSGACSREHILQLGFSVARNKVTGARTGIVRLGTGGAFSRAMEKTFHNGEKKDLQALRNPFYHRKQG